MENPSVEDCILKQQNFQYVVSYLQVVGDRDGARRYRVGSEFGHFAREP